MNETDDAKESFYAFNFFNLQFKQKKSKYNLTKK